MMRVASAGTVGALSEWYEFYIFATASALVFGRLFFAGGDPVTGTMAAHSAFSLQGSSAGRWAACCLAISAIRWDATLA